MVERFQGKKQKKAKMAASTPYANALREELEHTPVMPLKSEEMQQEEQRLREERIESELVVATMQQGRYASIYNTKPTLGKSLLAGLIKSKALFLFKVDPVKARIDIEKVKKEIVMLERVVIITYFVGGQQSIKSL